MKILLTVLVLLASQASFASECVRPNQIRNFRAINDSTLVLEMRNKQEYVMDVGFCSELRWARQIAFESFSSLRVCRGDRLLVLDGFSNYVKQSCRIYNIESVNN